MNYRHGFHAGNFADVLKHAVLARMLVHARRKDTPFRVIDTHAGRGGYDLGGWRATRTGEWRDGIGRLEGEAGAALAPELATFLAPYCEAVRAWRERHGATAYPGSPAIARHFLRPHDRAIVVEAHAGEFERLVRLFPPGGRVKALHMDGYVALGANLPPPERRGLVILDPPYEAVDEFERVADAIARAHRKWAQGAMLVWYPVRDAQLVSRFVRRVASLGLDQAWRVELDVGAPSDDGFSACGLLLIHPPWTLPSELIAALPALGERLSRGGRPSHMCVRL